MVVKAMWLIVLVAAAAILWWPRPTFQARWVSLPPAMSWDVINRARKAAERPVYVPICKWPGCRLS